MILLFTIYLPGAFIFAACLGWLANMNDDPPEHAAAIFAALVWPLSAIYMGANSLRQYLRDR